ELVIHSFPSTPPPLPTKLPTNYFYFSPFLKQSKNQMETPAAEKKNRKRPPAEVETTTPGSPMAARAVPEEEVEEFFAILRRIHVAVKYFEKSGGGASRKRRRPSFDGEELVEIDGGGENDVQVGFDGEASKAVVEEVVLDLNLDPPPDLTSDDN
ncbi:Protein NIM1-INTERACTING 2, partial [Linum grandiflorum]